MDLVKVTNIGLTLSDGTVIPVIRAVLSNYAGDHSEQEMKNLTTDIYNAALGSVSVCSYYTTGVTSTYLDIQAGETTYGNDEGFKLKTTVSNHYNSLNLQDQQWIRASLFYDGSAISEAYTYTGYGDYEQSFLILYTDEDYNILTPVGSITHSFQILSEKNIGVSLYNDIAVCGVWDTGVVDTRGVGGAFFNPTPGDNIKDLIKTEIDPTPEKDPYDPTGLDPSVPGGGGGNHDMSSDPIDIPALPSLSAVDTGFISLFNPSLSQLQALSDFMWSPLFDIDTIKKLYANPMDVILGLSIVPVNVPSGGTKTVKVAGISTEISMTIASSQYVEVDCGSINVEEYWGAYIDYEPYTKAEIYLPYIGTHPIAIDDIMGKTVKVVYHVDILSGSCTAYVKCGNSVLYSFIGQCTSGIPVTSSDWTNVINGALNIATAIGSMVATGGASAPAAVGSIASKAVNTLKPSIEKSGSMSGTGGLMAVQKPYLIITRPNQAIPAAQNHYMGYPSFITSNLGFLSGFTQVEHIHLSGFSATEEEMTEIENLLKGGVIL